MNANMDAISEAKSRVKDYENNREPERLREASLALQNVNLAQEEDENRLLLRSECLTTWFKILILFDNNYEPGFNLQDVPSRRVAAPVPLNPDDADTGHLTGKTKENFETAQQEHAEKINHYRAQLHLSRLKDFIPPAVFAFIKTQFTIFLTDQAEIKAAIEKQIKNKNRKSELLKLIEP